MALTYYASSAGEFQICQIHTYNTLYNVILRIARNVLEIRVIIKILTHPCCPRKFD